MNISKTERLIKQAKETVVTTKEATHNILLLVAELEFHLRTIDFIGGQDWR